MPSGIVKIDINDGKLEMETDPGDTLLTTLGNNKVLLPSACGGGGTCAMCRCQVDEGGGSILPTETGFFTRKRTKRQLEACLPGEGKRRYETSDPTGSPWCEKMGMRSGVKQQCSNLYQRICC